ncbi:NAD(P)H-hydrate epimerase [bacterium]|nr:MAG: NAD(P)H-hydrate epimerase [bacterium]
MSSSGLPALSSRQVKEVDALAWERFGISVDWLMEAAGWQVARSCPVPAAVVCGVGNNAGDGLAAARHLHRWGRLASVCCVDTGRLREAAGRELESLRRIGVAVSGELRLDGAEMVVDAIFGTGLSRPPEGRFAACIEAINASGLPVLAVDLPSGLDADSGVAYAPTVKASTTVTLGLPKPGLLKGDGPGLAGEVWVADIGVPFEAYAALGLDVPPHLFSAQDRVRLDAIR